MKNSKFLISLLAIFSAVFFSSGSINTAKLELSTFGFASVQKKEVTVYETKTGSKYHRSDCRYLRQSKIKTTKDKAIKKGLTACKVCKP